MKLPATPSPTVGVDQPKLSAPPPSAAATEARSLGSTPANLSPRQSSEESYDVVSSQVSNSGTVDGSAGKVKAVTKEAEKREEQDDDEDEDEDEESESESESREQSGSPTDVETTPHPLAPRAPSTEKPSSTPPQPETSSQGGSRTSSDRSESPADDDDEPRCSGLTSPRSRSSSSSGISLPPPPRVELGMLALAAIGWDE